MMIYINKEHLPYNIMIIGIASPIEFVWSLCVQSKGICTDMYLPLFKELYIGAQGGYMYALYKYRTVL